MPNSAQKWGLTGMGDGIEGEMIFLCKTMNTNIFRAYCGLDCEKCEARIATINNDDQLRQKVAAEWSEMNNEPSITPETINCLGCKVDGECKTYFCSQLCEVRKCCIAKAYDTCAECSDWKTCPKLAPFLGNEDVSAFMKSGE